LELSGEEGRGKLRKAWGSGKHTKIPGYPNGVTRPVFNTGHSLVNKIVRFELDAGN
jgi:hypothetical protein